MEKLTYVATSYLGSRQTLRVKNKAVANAQVSVAANTNIKMPVDLNLQLRRQTGTFMFI